MLAYENAVAQRKTSRKRKSTAKRRPLRRAVLWALRWLLRGAVVFAAILLIWISAYTVINPPTTPYIRAEAARLGGVDRDWASIEDIAPVMARSAVAAEDANFCLHWGFDMNAIRDALEEGANRGASTITQQVVKNAFLWQGRSWPRKALEALMTPVVELIWSKRRVLEVYLNVAEFDEGVFGVRAAALHYFGVAAADLTPTQAARLAAVLPNPKERSASRPSGAVQQRASSIADGAATIRADGRASCFQS